MPRRSTTSTRPLSAAERRMLRYESARTGSLLCSYPIVLYLYVHVTCRSGVLSLRRSQHSGCRHLVASHGRLLLPQRGSECVRKSTLPGTRQTANGRFSHPSITSMAPLSTAPTSQTPDIIDTPSWDTSPNTFPQYYMKLLKWLPRQESKYTTLAQYIMCSAVVKSAVYPSTMQQELHPRCSSRAPSRILSTSGQRTRFQHHR